MALTRLGLPVEKASWILIYIVPVYALGAYFSATDLSVYSALFFLSLMAFYSIYELGYLENDIKTVQSEKQPTIRLGLAEQSYYLKNYNWVVALKVCIAVLFFGIAVSVARSEASNIYVAQFLVMSVYIRCVFFFHNRVRNRGNILTFSMLSAVKYTAPLSLLMPLEGLLVAGVMLFFAFPLVRTMEHSTKSKYGLNRWASLVGNHDVFRVKYYGLMAIGVLAIFLLTKNPLVQIEFFLIVYFLLFRMSSLLLVRSQYFRRQEIRKQQADD